MDCLMRPLRAAGFLSLAESGREGPPRTNAPAAAVFPRRVRRLMAEGLVGGGWIEAFIFHSPVRSCWGSVRCAYHDKASRAARQMSLRIRGLGRADERPGTDPPR